VAIKKTDYVRYTEKLHAQKTNLSTWKIKKTKIIKPESQKHIFSDTQKLNEIIRKRT
jgi:hypothetical protein